MPHAQNSKRKNKKKVKQTWWNSSAMLASLKRAVKVSSKPPTESSEKSCIFKIINGIKVQKKLCKPKYKQLAFVHVYEETNHEQLESLHRS